MSLIPIADCRMPEGKLRSYTEFGSYPIIYHCKDGGTLCPKCAAEDGQTDDPHDPQWFLIGALVHYEGEETCDHCNEDLEPAYPAD
jgi:hypothetical protein